MAAVEVDQFLSFVFVAPILHNGWCA